MVKRLVMMAVVLAIIFGGIFGWKYYMAGKSAAMMSQPPPPAIVASAQVMLESWEPYLAAVGSVVATQNVFITTEVAGQVEKILFESGQIVKAEDVILQLDDSVDKAELNGLIAQGTLAKLQFDRNAKLIKDRTVSQSEYDRLRAELDVAEATIASKRAVIDRKSIRAPFNGRLGIRDVNIGQYLTPGMHILSLQALDPVFVDYTLPERHFYRVKIGQRVVVQVQAHPGKMFEGEVTAIDPGVDPGTRTLRARATLDNPEQLLRHGMFTEVQTVLPVRDDILTLPRTAITYKPYGASVFLVTTENGSSSVKRKPVKSGEVRDGRVEIIEGLNAGDVVVSAGQVKLRNGQQINIDNSVELDGRLDGG